MGNIFIRNNRTEDRTLEYIIKEKINYVDESIREKVI